MLNTYKWNGKRRVDRGWREREGLERVRQIRLVDSRRESCASAVLQVDPIRREENFSGKSSTLRPPLGMKLIDKSSGLGGSLWFRNIIPWFIQYSENDPSGLGVDTSLTLSLQ